MDVLLMDVLLPGHERYHLPDTPPAADAPPPARNDTSRADGVQGTAQMAGVCQQCVYRHIQVQYRGTSSTHPTAAAVMGQCFCEVDAFKASEWPGQAV